VAPGRRRAASTPRRAGRRRGPGTLFRPEYDVRTDSYRLINRPVLDDQCLAAVEHSPGFVDLRNKPCTGDLSERWRFLHPGFSDATLIGQLLNSHRLIQSVAMGDCLSKPEDTYVIRPAPCDSSYNQLWYIHTHY
jgi:hypothetical protein